MTTSSTNSLQQHHLHLRLHLDLHLQLHPPTPPQQQQQQHHHLLIVLLADDWLIQDGLITHQGTERGPSGYLKQESPAEALWKTLISYQPLNIFATIKKHHHQQSAETKLRQLNDSSPSPPSSCVLLKGPSAVDQSLLAVKPGVPTHPI